MNHPEPARDPVREPHQPIAAYYRTEAERAGFLREIFDSTATDYDKVERMLALGTGPWYRRQALKRAGLAPGMQVVDVGFGTGLVAQQAIALIGDAALLTGVDPSPAMMGAPEASAMPSESGMAMRKTTSDARTSWRGAEKSPGRAAGTAASVTVGVAMGSSLCTVRGWSA